VAAGCDVVFAAGALLDAGVGFSKRSAGILFSHMLLVLSDKFGFVDVQALDNGKDYVTLSFLYDDLGRVCPMSRFKYSISLR